jgi:site-specific recombinase XerD
MQSQKKQDVVVYRNLVTQFENFLHVRGYATGTITTYLSIAQRIVQVYSEPHNKHLGKSFLDLPFTNMWSRTGLLKTKSVRAVYQHLQRIYRESLPAPSEEEKTPVQKELKLFGEHLEIVCGLAPITREQRKVYVGHFLQQRFGSGPIDVRTIDSASLMHYVADQTRGYAPGTGSVIATSLRSYLKFLQFRGDIDPHLLRMIPSPPNRRLKDYPVTMSESQIALLVTAFDRTRPDGKRDCAMMLCMLQMGLRSSEVARLNLTDIDWHRSVIRLYRGKTHITRELPLMNRCGNALADYLKQGRPSCISRRVFVRHSTPVGSDLVSENVRGAMRRAYLRAGLPKEWTGTHILRHTAATRMLNNGASLKQIADVLGHQSIDTTMIYTKVDIVSLSNICRRWPGGRS